jgi:mannose-6-phosphate isomerase-like protein (cupin superfamily)
VPQLVHTDAVFRVEPGTTPAYDTDNPLLRLLTILEGTRLAGAREAYAHGSLQYLFPISYLQLWGPSGADADVLDVTKQDNKNDFQKQNVRDFRLADTRAVRGWAVAGGQRLPFLQLSYRAGPDSALARGGAALGDAIGLLISVRGAPGQTLRVPYDAESGRYVVELWGHSGDKLVDLVDDRGKASLDSGLLQARADLVQGGPDDFAREAISDRDLRTIAPSHAMHPILPLHVDVRWTADPDGSGAADPPQSSAPLRHGFEIAVRGWDSYLQVGSSANPHGGVGYLEYRNLFSEYFGYAGSNELTRRLEPHNLDAFGNKGNSSGTTEPFLAVTYMDLHVMESACGIGLHRHRDNQEVFLMLDGDGIMVIGDWADSGTRARAFEVRSLPAGSLAMLRGGNLHGLLNPADRRASLFMFGGYD